MGFSRQKKAPVPKLSALVQPRCGVCAPALHANPEASGRSSPVFGVGGFLVWWGGHQRSGHPGSWK